MKTMLRSLLVAVALFAGGSASAQRVIKAATQNPKGHPIPAGLDKFAELVAAKSGGKIKVNVFPGGTLGSDQANISALQGGTLEVVSMNSGILQSVVKEFGVFDFPFMFATAGEADTILDGAFGKKMHKMLEAKGLVGLAYFELGFRDLTNAKRAINKVSDIEGLKLRVIPNPINVDWVKALGANPTPLPWPEVYAALEQKAIDGQENPATVIYANKLFEVQKFMALTHHQYNPQSILVSKKFFDGLSAGDKKILADAAQEAALWQRQFTRGQADEALANLKKAGMTITELPAPEMKILREKMKPVIAKHGEPIKATVDELQAELAKVRK